MSDIIAYCVIAIVALSPLLRRFYMDRFWVHGRGTVIRLDGGINFSPGRGGGTWVWTPVIQYEAGGQRLTSKISSWQRLNGKSAYAVGDQVDILYDPRNPSRVTLDSWTTYIVFTLIIGAVMATMLRQPQ
jgi:hypothetical protein